MLNTGVYILECSNGRYYVGSTNDLARRIHQHNTAQVKATKYILPVILKAFISCGTLQEARRLEYSIKQKKSRKYIEQLIKENMLSER